jgi:hypothetical protein
MTSTARRLIQRASRIVAAVAAGWWAVLAIAGGFDVRIFGMAVRTHQPLRPLLYASIAFTVFVLSGGDLWPLRPQEAATGRERGATWLRVCAGNRAAHATLAVMLALSLCAFGIIYGTLTVGGSDSYGYASQAELWLRGHLEVDQPFEARVPWPDAEWTFAPLGYRPAERGTTPRIVPTYSPGLPILLAMAKALGGQPAIFVVVPLSAGVLVLATFSIGRRAAGSAPGLIAAWLVATSAPVLFQSTQVMTDVPVAAAFAAATFCLLGRGGWSALAAGLLAGAGVVIRPNLFPLAAVLGLHYLFQLRRADRRWRAWQHGLLFSAGVLPSIVFVALLNRHLYGSPFTSGYGSIASFYAWANVGPNLRRYLGWLIAAASPIVLVGFAVLVIPLRRFWPGLRDPGDLAIFALFVGALWLMYLAYEVFDSWSYLRFLLPSWPLLMLGCGAFIAALYRGAPGAGRAAIVAATVGWGIFQLHWAVDHGVVDQWAGERRYAVAGQLVGRATPANAVVFSMQHSGTVRYYGGRMTLRYDSLDPRWLDQAVAWLASHGSRSYLLAEDWEIPAVRSRFPGADTLTALARTPVFVYRNPGMLYLFDLTPGAAPGRPQLFEGVYTGLTVVKPAPAPHLLLAP